MNIGEYRDNIDYSKLALIKTDFFNEYSSLIDIKIEDSQNDYRNGKLRLSARVAYTSELFNLIHEIAHLIEIDDARCYLPDWGLMTGKYNEYFGIFEGVNTNQSIEREIRVLGIQCALSDYYDIDEEHLLKGKSVYRYMAELIQYIDGFYFYQPKNKELSQKARNNYAFIKIAKRIQKEELKWDINKIKLEWNRKMGILKEQNKDCSNKKGELLHKVTPLKFNFVSNNKFLTFLRFLERFRLL